MSGLIAWIIVVAALLAAAVRVPGSPGAWTAAIGVALLLLQIAGLVAPLAALLLWPLFAVVAVLVNAPELRRRHVTRAVLRRLRRALPEVSETERAAIEAGTVGWEGELFRGDPDWRQLRELPAPKLTDAEQAFLDGPVEELCGMLDDWRITRHDEDLTGQAWQFMRRHRFFGMIIPEEYGGLGFSAAAHSAVVMKLATRSSAGSVTVMVPNSLGPAELLLHYGTPEQKDHYLPRLARGEEIPCFALTGPWAGSDASAMADFGVACMGEHEGREVPGFRVTWEKRYITLAPVASVLGLAFRALDPDGILGDDPDPGITCALVPVATPGVEIGERHDPLGTAFQNGPTRGREVFIPLEWVIGGREQVGQGWRMLVESLAAGRGISLPASSTGAAKHAARVSGAYARVRHQFGLPLGAFEGVREALARIGGLTYVIDAARTLTTRAVDAGERPSVATAIVKYQSTELMRKVVNDAMDIHGGRAICRGPANYLSVAYQSVPISITVEGANILTRSMIIFGQGALRCHPWLRKEMEAVAVDDDEEATEALDDALMGHAGYLLRNAARSVVLAVTGGRLSRAPGDGRTRRYYSRLARYSASFALLSDVTALMLGGSLKRREHVSGRLADALGNMYLCSAALKRFQDDGNRDSDLPLLEWSCEYTLARTEQALHELLREYPSRVAGLVLRALVFPLGRRAGGPGDRVIAGVARILTEPGESRDRLTAGMFLSGDPEDPVAGVEHAMHRSIDVEPLLRRLRKEGHAHPVHMGYREWLDTLVEGGLIAAGDAQRLSEARLAVYRAISVDAFDADGLARTRLADDAA